MPQVQHWGVTGWSTEWASLEQDDDEPGDVASGFGFVRVVEPGVVYLKPGGLADWPTWAESPGNRQRRYQMPWPEDEKPETATVLDIHARLSPRRAALGPNDEELRRLDEALREMVRQVDRLHRAGGTLGFVQPDSVQFCRLRDGSLRVVFPDVGFAWDESRGLREPKWIAEPQLDCLFEEGARRHNAACLASLREAQERGERKPAKGVKEQASATLAAAQAEDVKSLGRLIAVALAGAAEVTKWCGAGKAFLAVPGRDRAPDTQAPIWDEVITPTLLGKVTGCTALLERLESAPPSAHYLFKPPVPPPLWKVVARKALPGVLGVAAVLALALTIGPRVAGWFKRPEPHPLCDTVYPDDPRFGALDALEEARAAAQKGDMEKLVGYWSLLADGGEMPVPCLTKLRKEAAAMIGAEALSIPGRLRDTPLPRREEIDLLQQAYRLLQAASEVDRANCERALGLLLRQLQARGVVPQPPEPPAARDDAPAGARSTIQPSSGASS